MQAQADRRQKDCQTFEADRNRCEADVRELEGLLRESERVGPAVLIKSTSLSTVFVCASSNAALAGCMSSCMHVYAWAGSASPLVFALHG